MWAAGILTLPGFWILDFTYEQLLKIHISNEILLVYFFIRIKETNKKVKKAGSVCNGCGIVQNDTA